MNANLNNIAISLTGAWWRWLPGWLLLFPALLAAQVFEAKTETREVALGSTFEVSFSLKDARGERFRAPDFPDFKVAGGPSEMRGMTIINGRSSSHQTWIYELEPKRTGSFTIGPASVVSDGKTLETKPLTIRVVAAKNQPNVNLPPGISDNLFIVGELDRERAYPGEQLTWRIKLFTQLPLEGADIIELPEFEHFYTREKRRFDTRVTYQNVRGKKYAVKTLYEEALFPQETGEFTIGAAKVRVGIEQPAGTFGAFLMPKPAILHTQPVRLTVRPLPAPVPENFTGGVGRYEWAVEFDRDSLSTDDALTLKISLRGNGDSKRFAPPKLSVPAGLELFEPRVVEEEEYENGEEVVHSKVFEYVILPKEPGEYALNPTMVVYDSDSSRFRTFRADSLPAVRVTPGKNYRSVSTETDTLPLPPPVATRDIDVLEKAAEWLRSPVFWSVLVLPLLLYGIFLLLKKRKPAPKSGPAPTSAAALERSAVRAARERFSTAARLLKTGDPRAFYDELFKSLLGYLTVRFHLSPAQMTQENVRKVLMERNVSSGTIQNLLSVWQTCEQALFAGQTQGAQMENTWRAAEAVVQELEKRLKG